MGLMGLLMADYGGLSGILTGLTQSTDHPLPLETPQILTYRDHKTLNRGTLGGSSK